MLNRIENIVDIYNEITHTPKNKKEEVLFFSFKDIFNDRIF